VSERTVSTGPSVSFAPSVPAGAGLVGVPVASGPASVVEHPGLDLEALKARGVGC
jgi:hypothetical protein